MTGRETRLPSLPDQSPLKSRLSGCAQPNDDRLVSTSPRLRRRVHPWLSGMVGLKAHLNAVGETLMVGISVTLSATTFTFTDFSPADAPR